MFENQEGKTYVEGFCIAKSLMKGKISQGDKNEKVYYNKRNPVNIQSITLVTTDVH